MQKGYEASNPNFELIWICDAGIRVRKDTLSEMASKISQSENIALVHQLPFVETVGNKSAGSLLEKIYFGSQHGRIQISAHCFGQVSTKFPNFRKSHQPRIFRSQESRIFPVHESRIFPSHQPRIFSSHKPRIFLYHDLSHQPRIFRSHEPRIFPGHESRIFPSHQPRIFSSHKPGIFLYQDLSYQPRIFLWDDLGHRPSIFSKHLIFDKKTILVL